jgi:hypothetical protein
MPGSFGNEGFMNRFASAFLAMVLVGCASAGARRTAPQGERNVLTREEIESSAYRDLDLYQTLRSLRPKFLEPPPTPRSRASTASMPTAVYIDRMRQSGIAALRTLRASDVDEVRYLDPTASQSELGPAAAGGALIVKLRKPGTGSQAFSSEELLCDGSPRCR